MDVCASDRAQVAHSYVRQRRVPAEVILIVRNSAPLPAGLSSHSVRNTAPYTAECARYAAECARYAAVHYAHCKLRKCARYAAEMRKKSCGNSFKKENGHDWPGQIAFSSGLKPGTREG